MRVLDGKRKKAAALLNSPEMQTAFYDNQTVSLYFFSFSEEKKIPKRGTFFVSLEISSSAELDLGRCPKNL